MRAVIQRVSQASVTIDGTVKGAIENGLLMLLAIEEADTPEDIEWLSGKIVRLRVFPDDQGVMNRSVQEMGGWDFVDQPVHSFRQHPQRKSSLV